MKVLKDLFGEIRGGRLGRVQFVAYLVATLALIFAVAFLWAGIAASVSAVIESLAGSLPDWQLYVLALPPIACVGFVWANLFAKRARDTGLPGWSTVLIWVLIGNVIPYLLPRMAVQVIGIIILAGFVLIPPDAFRSGSPSGGLRAN